MSSQAIFQRRWEKYVRRDSEGMPLLSPQLVIALGPRVNVVDVRTPEEATGVVGYIPGSMCLGAEQLDRLPRDYPVVLASGTGADATQAAKRLQQRGLTHVAVLKGGVVSWRKLGLGISRDPAGLISFDEVRQKTMVAGAPLTIDRIRDHIGDPRSVRWVKMVSLVNHGILSCIDGRDERGVIGTLGGNAGELLLMLAALERSTGVVLDESAVLRTVLDWLDAFGAFYMHTDDHALETLIESVGADPQIPIFTLDFDSSQDWIDFLRNPPAHVREALLEHLVDPQHIGCGHIRLMFENPEEYGVRRELVATVIRTIYRLCWDGAPEVQLAVLPGGHEEAAVINVRIEEEVWMLSHIPLISPSCGNDQMFVNHPDVASHLRKAAVLLIGGSRAAELQVVVDELAGRQLTQTVGHLAKGLPIFDAVFMRDGTIDVMQTS